MTVSLGTGVTLGVGGAGGGGYTLFSESGDLSVSTPSVVDFTGLDETKDWLILYTVGTSNSASVQAQFLLDGTPQTSAYYNVEFFRNSVATYSNLANINDPAIFPSVNTSSGHVHVGVLHIPAQVREGQDTGKAHYAQEMWVDTKHSMQEGYHTYQSATPMNGIRIKPATGTLNSGCIKVYQL